MSTSIPAAGVIHVTRGKLAYGVDTVTNHGDCIVFPSDKGQREDITVTALEDSEMLLLLGENIDEPVYSNGPFIASNPNILARISDKFNRLLNPFWPHTLSNEEYKLHVDDLQLQARLKE